MTAAERLERTRAADELCRGVFEKAVAELGPGDLGPGGLEPGGEPTGVALVAVGGYGRRELAPYSDLDVVLVHDAELDEAVVGRLAEAVLYPLWDAQVRLDHSVRTPEEVRRAAAEDVRVALGLLDVRHVAGDSALSLRLRTAVLAQWRKDARRNLPRLRDLVTERAARVGELAHAAVPDLKESAGGLRDATILKALVATWLVDVPHVDLERCRLQLLDLRDRLHAGAGRPTDRVTPELWGALADDDEPDGSARREHSAEDLAQRRLRQIGRRTAHLVRVTWSRVDQVLAAPAPLQRRAPRLTRLAPGVAVAAGEVVLERGADPARDPLLLVRAAATAAEQGLPLSPATAARLAAETRPAPTPWSEEARDLMVRLLASGSGLLAVWETLDETGALDLLLPEWSQVRLLPHASVVHRFTVDRHLVETCVEAAALIRQVARPDLLLVAALLHDIGKGRRGDHSVVGEPIAREVALRWGWSARDADVVAALVRWHLLLAETATSRDPEDPSTLRQVAERVRSVECLALLRALTEADARATSPKAWTSWRAALVDELVSRVESQLQPSPASGSSPAGTRVDPHHRERARQDPAYVGVALEGRESGTRVRVTAQDRAGLMADVSGALVWLRIPVRAARAWTDESVAVSIWDVEEAELDEATFTQTLQAVCAGRLDPAARLSASNAELDASVMIHHDASHEATVVEVRADDRPGVVHLVCQALASLDLSVRSAHVSTFGPQASDVFYVQELSAGALSDARAAAAAHAVREALDRATTLDV